MAEALSTADLADRHRRYLAYAMLACAFMFGANAAEHVVGPEYVTVAKLTQLVMVGLMFLGVLPTVNWKLRNRDRDLRHIYFDEDGYAARSLDRAKSASWVITFIGLVVLTPFTRELVTAPTPFFLHSTLALMVGVFSVVFLYFDRAAAADVEAEVA